MVRRWLCRLGFHHWAVWKVTDDGTAYEHCRRCGRVRHDRKRSLHYRIGAGFTYKVGERTKYIDPALQGAYRRVVDDYGEQWYERTEPTCGVSERTIRSGNESITEKYVTPDTPVLGR